ncbi:MAG: hypothetical protein M1838_002547 [Thelocarpon superellum]|nr:MAG: hypothetical protein M1838_002547 [Thelocarpon superellum]
MTSWMTGESDPWPEDGEIDILEQVNDNTETLMSLHTNVSCTLVSSSTPGVNKSEDCYYMTNNYQGCGIGIPNTQSFGAGFNNNGGGVYAVEWTSQAISIWFFPRNNIPLGVLAGTPDPSTWGVPAGYFHGDCSIDQNFRNHKIIFNTAFCGAWAANAWTPTCAKKSSSCNDYVANNPTAFVDAYWQINSLRVFDNNNDPTIS